MIQLARNTAVSPLLQTVPTDPGITWLKDRIAAIEPPPDNVANPDPAANWLDDTERSGLYGVVSPRIISLPAGRYRMYYTQIGPTIKNPRGANDYDHATSRILSAISLDGIQWEPEAGVRLSPEQGGAGEYRVVSSEVVPDITCGHRFRMYYECCNGPQSQPNTIRSALSNDGIDWVPESGARLKSVGDNYSSPRVVFLDDGRIRLYCQRRGEGIVSAVSDDGLTFRSEAGIRLAQDTPNDRLYAFAPEILQIAGGGFRMFYAGYSTSNQAQILTAVSADGLIWDKAAEPVIAPDGSGIDAVKSSEMCVIQLPSQAEGTPRYRMYYEACDGTAADQRGVWRIASATAVGASAVAH